MSEHHISDEELIASFKNIKPWYKKWWIWVIIVLVIGGIGAALDNSGDTQANEPNTSQEVVAGIQVDAENVDEPEAIKISAEELYEAYQLNQVAAKKKYEGKLLEINGVISNISSSRRSVYITLEVREALLSSVQVDFNDEEQVMDLLPGQHVTVIGINDGRFLGSIFIKDAEVISDSNSDSTVIEVTARELYEAYQDNEVYAEQNFNGKTLELTGNIKDFEVLRGRNYIIMNNESGNLFSDDIRIEFRRGQDGLIANLKKNDVITVIGIGDGRDLFSILVRDAIVKE